MLSYTFNGLVCMLCIHLSKINVEHISSFEIFELEYERHIDCATTNSMINNFLNVSKINDYENVLYLIT